MLPPTSITCNFELNDVDVQRIKDHLKKFVLEKLQGWAHDKSIPLEDIVAIYSAADEIADTAKKVSTLVEVIRTGEETVGEEIPIVNYFFIGYDMYKAMGCMNAWQEPEFEYDPTHEVYHKDKHLWIIDGTDTVVNDCDDDTTKALLKIALYMNKLTEKCDEDYFCTSINDRVGAWEDWMAKCPVQRDAIVDFVKSFGLKANWIKWAYQGKWDIRMSCYDCYNSDCPCYGKNCPDD